MTSANLSEEPIVIDNQEAVERLGGIADGFLVHNRDIRLRCDDSIVPQDGWRHTVYPACPGLLCPLPFSCTVPCGRCWPAAPSSRIPSV